jgi:catechol 2,3-dioxygenase-like lactoylglutathione lyase family enzyme
MSSKLDHSCIVVSDIEMMADFYSDVFQFERVSGLRRMSEPWLEKGTGLKGAAFEAIHLRLLSEGEDGPTLELITMKEPQPQAEPVMDRTGFMHLAFRIDDIEGTLQKVRAGGGSAIGEVAVAVIENVGSADFVFAKDPEGNILEIIKWNGP